MSNRDNQQRYGNSASDPPDRQAGVDKVEDRQRRTIRLLGGSAGVGLAASVLYAAQFGLSRFPSVLGSALIVAFGSAMSGGLLGFLFALPRGRRGEPLAPAHPPVQSQAAATGSSVQSDTDA